MEAGDEQLMLAYREGDAGAFEQLYKRHKGALFRFVLRSIRDRATAEELYQEIWMRAIEARFRYEAQAKFTTWLYTIAHNRLVDHWRKRGLTLVSLDQEESGAAEPPPAPPTNRSTCSRQSRASSASRAHSRPCRPRSARPSCCTRRRA
jgi:RNA polymerase sigma-70 factor (ECF subfamily)